MANLEQKAKMSPLQLSIVLVTLCFGVSMITSTSEIIAPAKQSAWVSIIWGGVIFCGAALLMVKLGNLFPNDTFVEYMPKLWGQFFGTLIVWWLNVIMVLMFSIALANFSRTITFFLFDRTPTEVIALGLMSVCIYGALQDFGTILRMMQIVFFIIGPSINTVWLSSLINFQPENLSPLWPEDWGNTITVSFQAWPAFGGYEYILLLLPLVHPKKKSLTFSISAAFGFIIINYTSFVLITIAVLSPQGIQSSPYPILEVIRGVQIPGTFVERLEGYFMLFWIPIALSSHLIVLWGLAQTRMRQNQYMDHRPLVLILAPLLYTLSILLDSLEAINALNKLDTWLALIFSFMIIPISLILAWRKKRSVPQNSGAT
ncbi:MAG: spore germination protein [Pelosinus sp.]|nr:spore germination protein [Pelosinus sp.]